MLKETIDKTRELTNNVKIAKNEINDAIVRGGGVRSKDLKGIPQNIRNMVNQYSKVAMGNPNINMPFKDGVASTYTIQTNAKFTIKKAIVFLENKSVLGINLENYRYPNIIYFESDVWRRVSLKIQNGNKIVLTVEGITPIIKEHFKIKSWIAIG